MRPESPAADAFTLSDMKTKPACAALTDTAALPAFLWALEKEQVCLSCALQADTAVPSEEQPVQESSAGPPKLQPQLPAEGRALERCQTCWAW